MSKFRFYITDFYSGDIKGTDNVEKAKEIALCEDFLVVDTETGQSLLSDGTTLDIKELS